LDPYPLLCTPLCKPKLWGGTRLAELFGKAPVAGESNIGETWEVADLPEGASAIANGPLKPNDTIKLQLKGLPFSRSQAPWVVIALGLAVVAVLRLPSDLFGQGNRAKH